MNSFIKTMSHNDSRTDNGMLTNNSSDNPVLDMFFLFGGLRHKSDDDIITIFKSAYDANPIAALKVLLFARDIKSGLGERRVFRVVLGWLYMHDRNTITHIVNKMEAIIQSNIARVDDFVWLASKIIKDGELSPNKNTLVDTIINHLFMLLGNKDISGIVAKWMPRKNSQYGNVVRYMRKHNHIETYGDYRRMISKLSNTVEQKMSAKKWNDINFEHVPSIAMKKYKVAFGKHNLLKPFIEKVLNGDAKINASRLYPGDIVKEIFPQIIYNSLPNEDIMELVDIQWNNLKKLDSLPKEFRAIPLIDVSESMYDPNYIPISNSIGVGLYIAENNPNPEFKDYFITFTSIPLFHKITGHNIAEKIRNASRTIGYDTNLMAAFDLILDKAVNGKISPEDMPTHLIVISDMEFNNHCIDGTDVDAITGMRDKYLNSGYVMPTICFWNVAGRIGNVPAKYSDDGVLLVSGYSQNILNFILKKGYENPYSLVEEVINNDRYSFIG